MDVKTIYEGKEQFDEQFIYLNNRIDIYTLITSIRRKKQMRFIDNIYQL